MNRTVDPFRRPRRARAVALASLASLALTALTALTAPTAQAGSLVPPAGPPASTMKTLAEAEPRTAVASLPGSASALHVISQPGSYVLTANLYGEDGKNGIEIIADNVTLDLNGFALEGAAGGSGIATPYDRHHGITIHDGTLRGWGRHGIEAANCDACTARGLIVEGTGGDGSYSSISLGWFSRVDACTVRLNGPWTGIQVQDGSLVTRCLSAYNGNGYELSGGGGSILDSQAVNNAGLGIYHQGEGIVARCTVQGGDLGVHTGASVLVAQNTVWTSNVGVNADDTHGLVERNHVRMTWNRGLQVAAGVAGAVLRRNAVVEGATGIFTDPSGINLVIGNSAAGNSVDDYAGGGAYGVVLDLRGGATITEASPFANVRH